jgi:chemotaxis signal transduction protein
MAFQDEKDAQLLEQMTDEEFWQRAHAQATEATRAAQTAALRSSYESAALHQYLACESYSSGKYFVPLRAIEAVIPASSPPARLPFAPRWLQGVQAWRGEIVAVVDLDHYLSGIDTPASGGMLLLARHPECVIGLHVPGVGLIASIEPEQLAPVLEQMSRSPERSEGEGRAAVVQGMYNGCPVLDMVALLADVTLRIGMAAHHV